MNRVVSLLPSSTKIICALGCGERLVGRSQECDYPPGVGDLPACTAPKFDPDGTSYQIDQRVKAILQEAVSVYRVDAILTTCITNTTRMRTSPTPSTSAILSTLRSSARLAT